MKLKITSLLLILALCFCLIQINSMAWEQKRYEGVPNQTILKAGLHQRFVVFQGPKGWFHVVTTTEVLKIDFAGTIIAEGGSFTAVKGVRLEGGDWLALSQDKKSLHFNFITKKNIDALIFKTNAKKLHFYFSIRQGKTWEPIKQVENEIFLGEKGIHPVGHPFVLDLEKGDTVKSVHKDFIKIVIDKEDVKKSKEVIEIKETAGKEELDIEIK